MSARIGGTWNKFKELYGMLVRKSGILVRKQGLSLKQAEKIFVLDKVCWTVVKPLNLLLRMRQHCKRWSFV